MALHDSHMSAGKPSILMAHSRYLIRGGEDESTDAEVALLRDKGHQVELVETFNETPSGLREQAAAAAGTIWSPEGFRLVSQHLQTGAYDILHVQNFFPKLSPAIYYAAARAGVPVVQAVRNYRLVCASANLFRDGRYCDACVGRALPLPAIRHACYRQSRPASAAIAAMQVAHRLAGTWQRRVSRYVALTDYVRDRLIEGGFPADRITVKPNFVVANDPAQAASARPPFALYVGRLSEEKGVDWLTLNGDLPLVVVGEGEVAARYLQGETIGRIERGRASIEFTGRLGRAESQNLMAQARFLVVPGQWPEPFGRVIVEAFAASTPVIAARAGGIPDLVDDGVNGFLFPPGNSDAFVSVVTRMSDHDLAEQMGRNGRSTYLARYGPETNYGLLSAIYGDVLREHRSASNR